MLWELMMTSSNGKIFRVTGPLCGEFTGHRGIPLTKASDVELWCFLWSVPWINGWVNNREAGDLRCSLWRHCNVNRPCHIDSKFYGNWLDMAEWCVHLIISSKPYIFTNKIISELRLSSVENLAMDDTCSTCGYSKYRTICTQLCCALFWFGSL